MRHGVAMPKQGPVTSPPVAPQGLVLPGGLGLCGTHAIPTVLPTVTPLSPPRLAAGLSSLSQGQVQNVLGCVQPPSAALQGYVQGSSMCRGQHALVESRVGTSGICSFPCTSPSLMAGGCASMSMGNSTSGSTSCPGTLVPHYLAGPVPAPWGAGPSPDTAAEDAGLAASSLLTPMKAIKPGVLMNLLLSVWGNRFAGKSVMLSQDMSKCGRHALPSLGALGHLLRERGDLGLLVHPWWEHTGIAGLSWKTRPTLQTWQSPQRALLAISTARSACLGAVAERKTVKPQREGLQVETIPLPSCPGVGIGAGCDNAR